MATTRGLAEASKEVILEAQTECKEVEMEGCCKDEIFEAWFRSDSRADWGQVQQLGSTGAGQA